MKQWRNDENAAALMTAERAVALAQIVNDRPGEAQGLEIKAESLGDLKRNTEALGAWHLTQDAWKRLDDGPGQFRALWWQAILHNRDNDEKAGRESLNQALEVARREVKRPLEMAGRVSIAGNAFDDHDRFDEAALCFQVVFSIYTKYRPGTAQLVETLDDLGRVARFRGDLVASRDYHVRALTLCESVAPDSILLAETLTYLAATLDGRSELTPAEKYCQTAISIHHKRDANSLDEAFTFLVMGNIYLSRGDLNNAERYYERSRKIRQREAPGTFVLARTLSDLGLVAHLRGNFKTAEIWYNQALAIKQILGNASTDFASTLIDIAGIASERGDLDVAESLLLRAEDIYRDESPGSLNRVNLLLSLGAIYWEYDLINLAEEYFLKAKVIANQQAPDSAYAASVLFHLGLVAQARNNWDAARDYFKRALKMNQALAGDSLESSGAFYNLGSVSIQLQDWATAKAYFEKTLAIERRWAPRSLDEAQTLNALGKVADHQGDRQKAEKLAEQAWSIVRKQRESVEGDEARQAFGRNSQYIAADLLRYQVANGHTSTAFRTLEEEHAQALQALLADRAILRAVGHGADWEAYRLADATYKAALQQQERLALRKDHAQRLLDKEQTTPTPDPEIIRRWKKERDDAENERDAAEREADTARAERDARWGLLKRKNARLLPPPLSLNAARHTLPAQALYVAFAVGQTESVLFLVRRSGPVRVYALKIDYRSLRRQVQAFRDAVTNPTGIAEDELQAASQTLAHTLFPAPALLQIGKAGRLLIAPDDILWNVPFAALRMSIPSSKGNTGKPVWLGLEKPLTYTPSLAVFAQTANGHFHRTRRRLSALVGGGGIYDRLAKNHPAATNQLQVAMRTRDADYLLGDDGMPPPPLAGTRIEAQRIALLYQTQPLLGEQFVKAAVMKGIQTADVVHLATHGVLREEVPLASGVLLTVADDKTRNGFDASVLEAVEIFGLKMRAQLVVLSACETGRGRLSSGEGFIGLTRAFLFAGSHSVVASQWKIADISTSDLMPRFHRYIHAGLPTDEALRRAMRDTALGDEGLSHPYFWAAFALTGDPSNPGNGQGLHHP
jgi:CHAT domain-containing protein